MIKYRLVCGSAHEFEGWFRNSAAYDAQAARGHIACPQCADTNVAKAVMAPSVAAPAAPEPAGAQDDMQALMLRVRAEIEANAEYVGPRFAEEARRIHDEEGNPRRIYGEASLEEVRALAEDGIPCMPLPRLPKDLN
jgi:hypothetical protein